MNHTTLSAFAATLAMGAIPMGAQHPQLLMETGHVIVDGRSVAYAIRHLPLSSFPDLPAVIVEQLVQRDCLIPQTYEAHGPENIVHASLEHAGSQDWAVLCSVRGSVSLLVFFASAPEKPSVLVTDLESERLQSHNLSGTMGFNWGIDIASPTTVHQAQSGLTHRPPAPDHDALADSIIDHRTIYHFFTKGHWTLLDMPVD